MYSKYLDSLIRQSKTGIKHATKKNKKKNNKENIIVSDWQEILYKDIQEIHLSIKWSQ
jgi:predicted ester cyclase